MTPDYYVLLGIDRDAGADAIKAGFRKARSAAHPDRDGGSDELAVLVNKAFECLTDPERRAIYDATGVDQPQPEETKQLMETLIQARAQDCLRDMFAALLDQHESDRVMLAEVGARLNQTITGANKNKFAAQAKVKKLKARSDRLIYAGKGESVVHEILAAQVEGIETAREGLERDLLIMAAALQLLPNYSTTEPPPAPPKYSPFEQQGRAMRSSPIFFSNMGELWK